MVQEEKIGEEKINNQSTRYHVHISGERQLGNELLHNFFANQLDLPLTCSLGKDNSFLTLSFLTLFVLNKRQIVLLLDCLALKKSDLLKKAEQELGSLPPCCYMAFINVNPNHDIEKDAVALGVRGVFYHSDPLATIKKGVTAIFNNELWFSRNTLSTSLSNFVNGNPMGATQNVLTAGLTKREKEILILASNGYSNDKIAEQLHIAPLTLKTHFRNIYQKIDAPNRMQAILWANENRLLLLR